MSTVRAFRYRAETSLAAVKRLARLAGAHLFCGFFGCFVRKDGHIAFLKEHPVQLHIEEVAHRPQADVF